MRGRGFLLKPETPWVVTRAEEIFGGSAQHVPPGELKHWGTIEDAARLWRERSIESSQFTWDKEGGRLWAVTEGRPVKKCPVCMMDICRGVLASGKPILVTKQGLWHEHK